MSRDHAYTCERCGCQYGGLNDPDTMRCPDCGASEADADRLRAERDAAIKANENIVKGTAAERAEAERLIARLRADNERLWRDFSEMSKERDQAWAERDEDTITLTLTREEAERWLDYRNSNELIGISVRQKLRAALGSEDG